MLEKEETRLTSYTRIEDILTELDSSIKKIRSIVVELKPENAKDLLISNEKSTELLENLLNLQSLHSIILRYHPEELYSSQKERIKGDEITVYNLLIEMSKDNSKLIDYAIGLFQYLQMRAYTLKYTITSHICFVWLTTSISKSMSFKLAVLNIISNYHKLEPYFRYLKIAPREQGEVEAQKTEGYDTGHSTALPKPPKEEKE